jgi:pantetheine-phosphate adenylyltransferase
MLDFPGTFDPLHHGHINVIQQACKLGPVTALLPNNLSKSPWLRLMEREKLVSQYADTAIVRGLSCTFASSRGASFVRGIKEGEEGVKEIALARINQSQTGVSTFFVSPSKETTEASSTVVRELVSMNGDWRKFAPLKSIQFLRAAKGIYPVIVSGGICAGKSTFCDNMVEHLRVMGIEAHHIDFDAIAKKAKERFSLSDVTSASVVDGMEKVVQEYRNPIWHVMNEELLGKTGIIFLEGTKVQTYDLEFLGSWSIYLQVDEAIQLERLKGRPEHHASLRGHDDSWETSILPTLRLNSYIDSLEFCTQKLLVMVDVLGELRISSLIGKEKTKTLLDQMNGLPRFYHSGFHIVHGLNVMEDNNITDMNLKRAWVYHDFYEDNVNPVRVPDDAINFNGIGDNTVIVELIKSTDYKRSPVHGGLFDLMHDVDFSIMGAQLEEYLDYTRRVRKEFNCSDATWIKGRLEFLEKTKNDRIFRSEMFRHLEDQAHQNLEFEILMLWSSS